MDRNFLMPPTQRKGRNQLLSYNVSPSLEKRTILVSSEHQINVEELDDVTEKGYDIVIELPDGKSCRSIAYKDMTAFQFTWKFAHIKGWSDKLCLLLQDNLSKLNMFRALEDHELIEDVIKMWKPGCGNCFHLIKESKKFGLFRQPADWLSVKMMDIVEDNETKDEINKKGRKGKTSNCIGRIAKGEVRFTMQDAVHMKNFNGNTWVSMYLKIKNSTVYLSETKKEEANYWINLFSCDNVNLYRCVYEFHKFHKPPSKHCFCLVPQVITDLNDIKCFSVKSEKSYVGWLTGFRLAKFGSQLYRDYCNAVMRDREFYSANVKNHEVVKNHKIDHDLKEERKVTLDFSTDIPRIITDDEDASLSNNNQIGNMPINVAGNTRRLSETHSPMTFRRMVVSPRIWYHGKVRTEVALMRLKRNGLKEGMFLIRQSVRCQDNHVLSVVHKGDVIHCEIFEECTSDGEPLCGLKEGPHFPSLDDFVEAYCSGVAQCKDFNLNRPCPMV